MKSFDNQVPGMISPFWIEIFLFADIKICCMINENAHLFTISNRAEKTKKIVIKYPDKLKAFFA